MARTAELQAANRELEGFSYSVAHDLCAPLRTISGFSRALQEDYGDQLALEAQEYLRRLRAGCTSMAERIEDLLRLSRATTGELERSTVDISRLAGQIAAGLAETGRGRQVQFVISPELTAQADGRLLHIALENLLSNAWKYTSRRPSAVIEVGCYVRDDGQRVFLVRDNGAGFDMKFAGRLFMPFQRLHATTQFDGTGVGLATVQRIIARHGGSIWAQAAIDQGATFFFTVP
jgi:light-regulated signal transduction histidine kinase (bacteriophytochrome)